MKLYFSTSVNKDFHYVVKNFNRDLFIALTPPMVDLEVKRFDGCKKDDQIHLEMKVLKSIKSSWISIITTDYQDNSVFYFIDEGTLLPPPLQSWKHIHRVEINSQNETLIIDDIEYSCGNKLFDQIMYPFFYAMFAFRKPVYQKIFK